MKSEQNGLDRILQGENSLEPERCQNEKSINEELQGRVTQVLGEMSYRQGHTFARTDII